MNAPYDGNRDRAASFDDAAAASPPPPPEPRSASEPTSAGSYGGYEPYAPADPAAPSPYANAPYGGPDQSPYPPQTSARQQGQQYGPPPAAQTAPGQPAAAQSWAGPPAQQQGPSVPYQPYGNGYGDYADDATTQQFPGQFPGDAAGDGQQAAQQPVGDPYGYLFRDQRDATAPQPQTETPPQAPQQPAGAVGHQGAAAAAQTVQTPVAAPGAVSEADAAAASRPTSRAGNLLKSSALMAAGTLVSRVTGFLRTLVIGGAIGVSTLNDSYQVANTLPTMIYILVGGGALNAVFVPQLVRAMKNDEDGGEAYANRLLTLVVVGLAAVTTVMVLGAPVLVRLMSDKIASDPVTLDVAVAFTRYCLPTMFFMGVHVVLGQILNARGRFGAMMWTPVLNNVVVIATFGAFIWVYGTAGTSRMDATTIPPEGVRLLGVGTLLGLVVQALAMVPYLRDSGLRIRPRFDWRGHGLGHAAKLAKWTFLFVLANQAGMVVVIQLATWAGAVAAKQGHPGTGITAYNYALLLWQMPQAIITVSVMTAVLPRISRAAADNDADAVRDDLSYGLRTSAVAIVPCAFAFLSLGVPMATLMYSSSGMSGARNIGYVLMAFGLGLIPYSVQYVVLRGFYAYEDTRTPFYNTVIVAVVNAAASTACFLTLPARWAVAGMAGSYGLAYAVGVGVAVRRLRRRLGGDLDGPHIVRTYARLIGASVPAALVGGVSAYGITEVLGSGFFGSLAGVIAGGILLLGIFFVAAKRMRIEEMTAMVGMVRGRLGR